MKSLHYLLISLCFIGLINGQILKSFFNALTSPFDRISDGLKKVLIRRLPVQQQQISHNEKLNKTFCRCRLDVRNRIVGGNLANHIIPWQAILVYIDDHTLLCGAAIVNSHFVITSAHCVVNKRSNNIKVRVGVTNIKKDEDLRIFDVSVIYQHSFTSLSSPGDIALLKLAKPIVFDSQTIEPACLNLIKIDNYGDLIASGFGTTTPSYMDPGGSHHRGNASDVLKISHFYEEKDQCRDFLICINSKSNDSVCSGDSGTALMHQTNGITSIEGSASFVRGKGRPNERIMLCTGFAGYSRFSYYLDFIESVVGKEYCTKANALKLS